MSRFSETVQEMIGEAKVEWTQNVFPDGRMRLPEKINLRVINHEDQRYPTVGDWQDEETIMERVLKIRASKMSDPRFSLLVALHETIEAVLCLYRGISEADVDAFDKEFEAAREKINDHGLFEFRGRVLATDAEPGDQLDAPYQREHFFATTIERLLAAELGVDWGEYEAEIESLP